MKECYQVRYYQTTPSTPSTIPTLDIPIEMNYDSLEEARQAAEEITTQTGQTVIVSEKIHSLLDYDNYYWKVLGWWRRNDGGVQE
jgi:hypothetical protein